MNVSPNTLAKNKNFKKLRQGLIDEKALVRTTITVRMSSGKPSYLSSSQRKDLKRLNTNSELSQNHCTEKQIMLSKTTINWLFNNI